MKKSNGNSAPSRRHIIKGAGVLAAGIAAPAFLRIRSAYAAYPERPVKIVVANTPGGPSDIAARIVTAALQQTTGKTFIVENRGGAGGNIGMGYAANAEPDGYTILLSTNAFSVNVSLYQQHALRSVQDFVGVSELASSPNTFAVKSDLPAKTMKEFVALARANPDKYNCATPPIGTTPQIAARVSEDPSKTCRSWKTSCSRAAATRSRAAQRQRATELRLAAAGAAAHQGRHAALPRGHRRTALARHARRADHGGGRLQGFRVRDRYRAAGAGQDAAGGGQVAGDGNAQGPLHART